MKIFIMRHGEAEALAESDAQRALTERGQNDSIIVAKACASQYGPMDFDKVLVSPYLRAQETWQAIAPYVSGHCVDVCDDITPYGQADDVFDYILAISEHESLENVLLVSHLPLVGYLVSEFVKDIPAPMFTTSSLYCVEYDPKKRKGEVLWSVRP
ncbi:MULTISPECIES: phosphohistidine phosphatase SixA [Vibrio]|uniref:Phosphohistidine phosphatase SixA n=2 Tax=Vibrio TaxID=662 RepID=A0A7X4LI73_9VIBR|nr:MULTISPECIES: phosphohistidine phosphatase SixA [Vibrio]MBF8999544.1 phosphohistidine phosphatase SixA [Vibrio nitrifigilis]MZI92116.1 phosphohistidine phosphatase SixA [Vibrio eleionomae]